jgi:hypothetical protein
LAVSHEQILWDEALYSVFLTQCLDDRHAQSTWDRVCRDILAEQDRRGGKTAQTAQTAQTTQCVPGMYRAQGVQYDQNAQREQSAQRGQGAQQKKDHSSRHKGSKR